MKHIIAAAILLTLSTPAFAAKWDAVPKATQRDILEWEDAHGKCTLWTAENYPGQLAKLCKRDEVLQAKLYREGYCTYGHGVVGRQSGKHCYQFDR